MFVGGEFYEDAAWVSESPALPIEDAIFLNGGRACLSVIAEYLCANGVKQILLPSYLCPSILDVLDHYKIGYTFYKINEDFSIDIDDLISRVIPDQTLYFINYFGFQHSPESLSVLRHLQSTGILLIEDNAQASFEYQISGDFCFNSMRKFCGYDGGYLATRNISLPSLQLQPIRQNNRLPIIREYRKRLRSYLFEGSGKRDDLDRLFYLAESYYEKDGVILGNIEERQKIESLDWKAIKDIRRSNYLYLLSLIGNIPNIHPVYPALQADIMPMGLPVYVSEFSRDLLIDLLAEESISLTVHWDALLSDARVQNNHSAIKMAQKILTLPVDQYTNKSQLDYLCDHLARTLSSH